MTGVTTRALQVRLLILVVTAFLPALGFFWYVNGELRNLQMESKEQELVRRAHEIATDYEALLEHGRDYLATLAEFPEVRDGRSPACGEYLRRSMQHMEAYTTISLIGMDGYLACGAVTPEVDLYLGDRAYFQRSSSRNAFAIGEFALGRMSGLPVVGIAHPISDGAGIQRILAGSLNLNRLAERASATPLPEGYTFTVLDRDKRVMVRLPRTGNFTLADSVGSVADALFPAPPARGDPVVVEGRDMDGIERLFAVASLGGLGDDPQGYLAFGRTRVTLMEEVDAIVDLELRFLAGGALILLILAWALGHFWVARPQKP